MKRFIILILVSHICCFCSKTFGQVVQFTYLESFENETFMQGENLYFITNWFGNYIDNIRIFQENTNVKNGTYALGLWPISEEGVDSEEIEISVKVNLDLTGLENVVLGQFAPANIRLYPQISACLSTPKGRTGRQATRGKPDRRLRCGLYLPGSL